MTVVTQNLLINFNKLTTHTLVVTVPSPIGTQQGHFILVIHQSPKTQDVEAATVSTTTQATQHVLWANMGGEAFSGHTNTCSSSTLE